MVARLLWEQDVAGSNPAAPTNLNMMIKYSPLKKLIVLLIIIALNGYLSACVPLTAPLDKKCIAYRAAFDIGSGTTKMKVAKVNICAPINAEIIYRKEIKVPYAENYQSGLFNQKIRNAGIIALQQLKNEAINNRAEAFAGVATESFRRAADSAEFFREVKTQTGLSIKLIDQDQEAILGYQAVSLALTGKNDKFVVWDIGGASMQMIFRQQDQKFIIYRGEIASVSFKEKILTQIKQQKPEQHSSPNPIGKENLKKAIELAGAAADAVPEEMKRVIREPDAVIIGIGGVHNESIKKQLQSNGGYTHQELINAVNARIEWNDKDIGGHYADTEISNLILVLGFMEKLGINEVIPVNVNLADGVLIDPAFW